MLMLDSFQTPGTNYSERTNQSILEGAIKEKCSDTFLMAGWLTYRYLYVRSELEVGLKYGVLS